MFGGPHHNDEQKRAEPSGESRKNKTLLGEKLAIQVLLRLRHGCQLGSKKTLPIALDAADFVRHVPGLPPVSSGFLGFPCLCARFVAP
jgi:hypothetical protein